MRLPIHGISFLRKAEAAYDNLIMATCAWRSNHTARLLLASRPCETPLEMNQPADSLGPSTPRCLFCQGALTALTRCAQCGRAGQVGPYVIERLLSEHPHSRVYVARSASARVAVKELIFSLVPRVEQLDAFQREAALLRSLATPQTPRFIESLEIGEGIDTRLYLVQEFIDGESLATRLEREPVTGVAFEDLVAQSLKLLEVLHGRTPKVLHRDIKPANLMFRPSGKLVLVDFGSARWLERDVTHGATLVGSFGYMPFEQLGGTVDETSDLYALGATLLHAATGKPPASWLVDGISLDFTRAEALTTRQRTFLQKLTASRARRFTSANEALAWWRSDKGRPRWPRPAGVMGLSALAAALAFAFVLRSSMPASPRADLAARPQAPLPPPPVLPSVPPPAPQRPPSPVIIRGPPPPELPRPPTAEQSGENSIPERQGLRKECVTNLRALFQAEEAAFAYRDRYEADLERAGFGAPKWCPDGARPRTADSTRPGEVTGCHFNYGVIITGTAPFQGLYVYARGGVPPVENEAWVVAGQGTATGVVEKWSEEELLAFAEQNAAE